MLPKDFYLDNRYFYSLLRNEEKRLYRFMIECLLNNQRIFVYGQEYEIDPNNLEYDMLPMFIYELDEWISIVNVWNAVVLDCPEFYYVEMLDFIYENNIVIMGKKESYYSIEEINDINQKLNNILAMFDSYNDAFNLELAVNEYISKSFTYDYETPDYFISENDDNFDLSKWKRAREKFSIVGVVKYGTGVCSSMALLAQYILQRKGVKVINMEGKPLNEADKAIGHRWLMVNIEGNYYHLDVTWNNVLTETLILPQNMFFNITSEEAKNFYVYDESSFSNIACNDSKYNYYHKLGLYYENLLELKNNFKAFIKNNKDIKDILYFYFKLPENIQTKSVYDVILEVLEEVNIKASEYGIKEKYNYYAVSLKIQ